MEAYCISYGKAGKTSWIVSRFCHSFTCTYCVNTSYIVRMFIYVLIIIIIILSMPLTPENQVQLAVWSFYQVQYMYVRVHVMNDAILMHMVAMVLLMSLVISNKLLVVGFQLFFTSFEPSDITPGVTDLEASFQKQIQKHAYVCMKDVYRLCLSLWSLYAYDKEFRTIFSMKVKVYNINVVRLEYALTSSRLNICYCYVSLQRHQKYFVTIQIPQYLGGQDGNYNSQLHCGNK